MYGQFWQGNKNLKIGSVQIDTSRAGKTCNFLALALEAQHTKNQANILNRFNIKPNKNIV